ncbi:uncharacterized protein B0H64DRAFT_452691 [Chaetomium fimeti]|uniref:Uncharacterized protein n=1 Tax=Chaetomium fimeti TaxID=1854472 RepID=A0AAE0LMD2_9PEZI|nr:hypothetical protein B0H64DRAFT_452691 [Chaetomium fimeti]
MSSTPLPAVPHPPVFHTAFLDDRRRPEPTLSKAQTEDAPKKTRPLAASPMPAEFYSQYQCPVCHKAIAEKHGADFIGHTPCLHRGPCPRSSCIRAYYGTGGKWATPYEGTKPLFCQAAGCGRRIDGWCFAKAVMTPSGGAVLPMSVVDPALQKAFEKAKAKRDKEEKREKRENEKTEKRKRAEGEGCCGLPDVSPSRVLDCCFYVGTRGSQEDTLR